MLLFSKMEAGMLRLRARTLASAKKGGTVKKKSIMETIPVLLLLGLLAGAVGGLGVGMIQLKAAQSSASSAAGK